MNVTHRWQRPTLPAPDAGQEHRHGTCATSPVPHPAIQQHDDRGGGTVLEEVTTDHPTTRSRPCS